MRTQEEIERADVLQMLARIDRPFVKVGNLEPPAPDVGVQYVDQSIEVFEVTEIHPDEGTPHRGSQARAHEERRARKDPHAIVPSWVPTEALPSIRLRVTDKIKKAVGYAVRPGETLSLLLVGSIPQIGAITSTYVFAPFVTVDRLNAELHESLAGSRFQRAYLHLLLSGHAVWGWTPQSGWTVPRAPEDFARDGQKMLDSVKSLGSGVLPPGTRIFGWPR
jgi:hypothetical protein